MKIQQNQKKSVKITRDANEKLVLELNRQVGNVPVMNELSRGWHLINCKDFLNVSSG